MGDITDVAIGSESQSETTLKMARDSRSALQPAADASARLRALEELLLLLFKTRGRFIGQPLGRQFRQFGDDVLQVIRTDRTLPGERFSHWVLLARDPHDEKRSLVAARKTDNVQSG